MTVLRSLDLTYLDLLLWGGLQNKVHQNIYELTKCLRINLLKITSIVNGKFRHWWSISLVKTFMKLKEISDENKRKY